MLDHAKVLGDAVDLYIFGNGHCQLLPRQAAFKAGIPDTVNGYDVDIVCSSGIMSIISAATAIATGDADIVLAGRMESMGQHWPNQLRRRQG